MTDVTPDSQIDQLTQEVAHLKQELTRVNARMRESDATILKILQLLKTTEETFTVRVVRELFNVFSGVTHNLEHSIEHYSELVSAARRGFTVDVVDGKNHTENAETIVVTKVTEDTYNYAKASDPDTILNEGTEPFTAYFNSNPDVFGDRREILINVSAYNTIPQEVAEDV